VRNTETEKGSIMK